MLTTSTALRLHFASFVSSSHSHSAPLGFPQPVDRTHKSPSKLHADSPSGGAYHYATFLLPDQYRRPCSYVLGWFNYVGWVLTHAACCGIVASLTLALVNLCQPEFDTSTRWQQFLVFLALDLLCWMINLFGVKGIPNLEILGCMTFQSKK